MPQPADYLGAYMILGTVAILGCGVAVIALVAVFDHLHTQHKRARRRRG
ncbi:membrane protein [Streptomyces phage Bilo]|nr:membrane protein [Streptomyces phage Bilo]